MLVESVDGSKVLLGRAKTIRHESMLTCLSGFVEQVETIEEACRREVMEEAGISVGPVHIAGSQPWPMGAPSTLHPSAATCPHQMAGAFLHLLRCSLSYTKACHCMLRTCHGACALQDMGCIVAGKYYACMLLCVQQSVSSATRKVICICIGQVIAAR